MRHERVYNIVVCDQVVESGPDNILTIISLSGTNAQEAYEIACDLEYILPENTGKIAVVSEIGSNKPIFIFNIIF